MVVSYAVMPEGLWWRFEYNSLLFEAATIQGMITRFKDLLASVADHADQPTLQAPQEEQDDIMALLNDIEASR